MADLTNELNKIKHAVYGEEVRDSIVEGIRKMNADVDYIVKNYSIDSSLTQSGKAADAKVTGDQLRDIQETLASAVEDIQTQLENVEIDPDDLGLVQDPDTFIVYPTYKGIQSVNGIPLSSGGGGSGGGGGSTNNAVVTMTNTTGWNSATISSGVACPLSFTWSSIEDENPTGDGTLTVKIDNITKKTQNVVQGSVTIDVGEYLSSGNNKVKLMITDVYGNSKVIAFTINSVALTITSHFDTSGTFIAGNDIVYTYTPVGNLEKTVYFVVDGDTEHAEYDTVTTSGRQQSHTIAGMAHGAHSLEVYFTAEVNGETVSSNKLRYDLIVLDPSSSVPIIASTFDTTSTTQYTTLLIKYKVYTPDILTSEITLSVNDEPVSELTVDRSEQTWSYRADVVGDLELTIATGSVTRTFEIEVEETDIDAVAETDSLSLHLTSYGRSNNEADPSIWTDSDNDIECELTYFNFVSDGWITDSDGITALRVSGDARVTIPYKVFRNDFRATGKTIEIEFATRNVLDYDSVLISAYSGDRGFKLTAQKALLKSEQSEISTQYKEDEHVRIAFVIDKRTEDRLLYIYINGIMSGVIQYPDDDDFSQVSPVDITIGSNDCTTDIYTIRVYDNNLTRYQIVNNWIADTQDITTMLARYEHNHIYDEYGNVIIDNLPDDLPYMVLEAAELPQYKGDKKTISGYYVDPTNSSKSFTFTGAQFDVQGTSSQYYPRKNYKGKFKGGFVINGTQASKYQLSSTCLPTNVFCFKADVASSEGANNVELVRLYERNCPYKTPAQEENSLVRQGIDGYPMVMFWSNTTDGTVSFIGKYNFNLDKGAEECFGFVEGDESWEVKTHASNLTLYKSADYSGDAWLNDFEARFPDTDPPYTDKTQLEEFAVWMVSCDPDQATGNDLASSVTYTIDDVTTTYTKDTAEYRLAKFKAEFGNYVEVESALFYYLFTELFLMVDSRSKNMFPSFMGTPIN